MVANNPDAEIILHSKYASQLINNFCATIKELFALEV